MSAQRTAAMGRTGHRPLLPTARPPVCALLLIAHCALAGAVRAQSDTAAPVRTSAFVRYGKWAALGAAASFTILGATAHDRADRDYEALLDHCRSLGPCSLAPDGRYADPAAEALYRRVRDGDRRARAWLVSGQLALLTGAVLFVADLKRGKEPRNIPFSGYVEAGRFGTKVGVQVRMGKRR